MGIPWDREMLRFLLGKKRKHSEGGIVPPSEEEIRKRIKFRKKGVEFKVEKVYDFKKDGRYYFVITTEKRLTDETYSRLKEILKAEKKRLLKELGIISSFIVLDDGTDIRVVPKR